MLVAFWFPFDSLRTDYIVNKIQSLYRYAVTFWIFLYSRIEEGELHAGSWLGELSGKFVKGGIVLFPIYFHLHKIYILA